MSDDTDDDRVGYRRPPKRSQFKKGQTGNPGGRPRRRGTSDFDLDKLLDRAITVKVDGQPRVMQAKEVELRQLLDKALKKADLAAIEYLLDLMVQYGAIEPPPDRAGGFVIIMPNDCHRRSGIWRSSGSGLSPGAKKTLPRSRRNTSRPAVNSTASSTTSWSMTYERRSG